MPTKRPDVECITCVSIVAKKTSFAEPELCSIKKLSPVTIRPMLTVRHRPLSGTRTPSSVKALPSPAVMVKVQNQQAMVTDNQPRKILEVRDQHPVMVADQPKEAMEVVNQPIQTNKVVEAEAVANSPPEIMTTINKDRLQPRNHDLLNAQPNPDHKRPDLKVDPRHDQPQPSDHPKPDHHDNNQDQSHHLIQHLDPSRAHLVTNQHQDQLFNNRNNKTWTTNQPTNSLPDDQVGHHSLPNLPRSRPHKSRPSRGVEASPRFDLSHNGGR